VYFLPHKSYVAFIFVGHSCLNLVKLIVSSTGITNSGIFSLCQACRTDEGCKKLVVLDITNTMVDSFGALHCIQNLTELQRLNFNNICQVIERDIAEKLDKENPQPYKLRQLQADFQHSASPHSIKVACQWCPNLTEGSFYTGINSTNIAVLKGLKNLRELTLGSDGSATLNFQNDILPLLKVIGEQLIKFECLDVGGVDIILIGKLCPRLQSLFVILNSDSGEASGEDISLGATSVKAKLFSSLTEFNVTYPFEITHYQLNSVICLLKSATSLKTFICRYMHCLTDELLLDVYAVNLLSSIERVQFEHCNNIQPAVIWPLVEGANNLRSLHILDCWNITRADFDHIESVVRNNNFDLEVLWK